MTKPYTMTGLEAQWALSISSQRLQTLMVTGKLAFERNARGDRQPIRAAVEARAKLKRAGRLSKGGYQMHRKGAK